MPQGTEPSEQTLDVDLPQDFQKLFADDEVDAKFQKLEEAQKNAPPPGSVPEVPDEDSDEEKKGEAKDGKQPKKKKKGPMTPEEKQKEAERKKKEEEKKKKEAERKKKAEDMGKKKTKDPPKWKHLLEEQVELRELRVKSISHKSTWLCVLHPCLAWKVKRKLASVLGLKGGAWKDIKLIYLGQLMKDTDEIPDECYTAKRFNFLRWTDGPTAEAFLTKLREEEERRARAADEQLRLLRERQAKKEEEREKKKAIPEDDRLIFDDDDESGVGGEDDVRGDERDAPTPTSAGSLKKMASFAPDMVHEGERKGLLPAIGISKRNLFKGGKDAAGDKPKPSRRKTSKQLLEEFDLGAELEKIKCGQYTRLLTEKGFADKGAFAYATEAELMGPGIWLPKRACKRILGLADFFKRQIEIEDQAVTSGMAELRMTQDQKTQYTVDNVHFFNTQQELNAWVEEQRNYRPPEKVREMSVKREHAAEVLDLYESIEARLKAEAAREEGQLVYMAHVGGDFCCDKHKGIFDVQIEEIVKRDAVDYENDYNLILGEANAVHSEYLPGDTFASVLVSLFQKHCYPFRQKMIDDMLEQASLDDNRMYFDDDLLRKTAVELLKNRRRHLLLDLKESA